MSFANYYLQNYTQGAGYISAPPLPDLNIIVTIPCINEPNLISSLNSLKNCQLPQCSCEVIIAVNSSENAATHILHQNSQTIEEANKWIIENNTEKLRFFVVHAPNLPKKWAGAGLARKIAMDEAVYRFNRINKPNGIIACFDADSLCDANYLTELEKKITENVSGASIYFEHPTSGTEFEPIVYKAITEYELYLRYYKQAIEFTRFPYSFHTVGSSMAVRAEIYAKQGGMNRKKAGEDFYFLHKIIPLGNFIEINTTRIIPSPRPSDRVPFGTGAAITKSINQPNEEFITYHPLAFVVLKDFFEKTDNLFIHSSPLNQINEIQPFMLKFLSENDFENALIEIKKHSPTIHTFRKRFFDWFNAFRILKYLNYSHEHELSKINLSIAASHLLKLAHHHQCTSLDTADLLNIYRNRDRKPAPIL